MRQNTVESIVENLFYVLPLIHKKLLKVRAPEGKPLRHLSRVHMSVMSTVNETGLPISEIARRLLIPKSQMTHLIVNMEQRGFVERQTDPRDRRVTTIRLTPTGKAVFKQTDEFLKDNVRKNLSYLSEKELEELSQILIRLRELGWSEINERY